MSNSVNIHPLGIQINFPTWEKFNLDNLTNDGVVLFQYLVHHCRHNPEWTHSDNDLHEELGLKRTRLTTLRKKFIDAGILQTRIIRNQYDNKITAYRLNFAEIAKLEKLKLIYREKTPKGEPINLSEYSKLYKALGDAQPKVGVVPGSNSRKQTPDQWQAKQFATRLENVFSQRRTKFNQNRKPNEKQATGTIKFSPKHIQKLANALRHFQDQEYIENSFIAFVDILNWRVVGSHSPMLPENPRSPLNYFLSYSNQVGSENFDESTVGNSFAVIYSFGEYYTANYHVTKT